MKVLRFLLLPIFLTALCNNILQAQGQPPYAAPHPALSSLEYLPQGMDLHHISNDPWNEPWKLVFEENFNAYGDHNNYFNAYTDRWNIWDGEPGDGLPHVFYYSPYQVQMKNGLCYLKSSYMPGTPNNVFYEYASGRISLQAPWSGGGNYIYETGMFEIRMKMSTAYWAHDNMWPTSNNRGEIDACEMSGGVCRHSNKKSIPHHLHGPKFIDYTDYACDYYTEIGSPACDDFHTYTVIWDKYFIYFVVDHDMSQLKTIPKLKDGNDNFYYGGVTDNHLWYQIADCFININEALETQIDQGVDSKWSNIGSKHGNFKGFIKDLLTKQNAGMPGYTVIDWFKIYQRDPCSQDQVITSSRLFPYLTLDERSITLGTNAISGSVNMAWASVSAHRDPGVYKATYINIVDNFEFNANTSALTTTFDFQSKECPEQKGGNEYVWDTTKTIDTVALPYVFTCADLDSAVVDSLLSGTDTAIINAVYSFLDSVGCDYLQGSGQGGQARFAPNGSTQQIQFVNNAESGIVIYPNPSNGSFTVRSSKRERCDIAVTNVVGQEVYKASISDKVTNIKLPEGLSQGTYTIRINGPGVNYIEKLVLIN